MEECKFVLTYDPNYYSSKAEVVKEVCNRYVNNGVENFYDHLLERGLMVLPSNYLGELSYVLDDDMGNIVGYKDEK